MNNRNFMDYDELLEMKEKRRKARHKNKSGEIDKNNNSRPKQIYKRMKNIKYDTESSYEEFNFD